jgi:glycosyltransferase involved in cell wall biosynthesis
MTASDVHSPGSLPTGSVVLLVPGDLGARTGGYGYDREMVRGLTEIGWRVDVCGLDGSFPFPTEAARKHARRSLAAMDAGTLVLADGLAFGAMADEADAERDRLRFVALVHHPLALEQGLDEAAARRLVESETRALAASRGVVVTSAATVQSLTPYGVPPDAVAVVRPGTTLAPIARGTRGVGAAATDAPVELLCVASITPRKGHDVLFDALARLGHRSWHLTCAGAARTDGTYAAEIVERLTHAGLADRVTFAGDLAEDALAAAYNRADAFVLPTRHEGYGMAVAEAVMRGLPVVSTPTGAIPELVDARSGAIVPIDDVAALMAALDTLIADDSARARLAAGARARRRELPGWRQAAGEMAMALARFRDHGVIRC